MSARAERALEARRRAVDRYLAKVLPGEKTPPARLHACMRYVVLAPGKRLRPLLVLATAEAMGGPWRKALPAAAAVELVHAFSLVHDDLPAMDDDDYRRGRRTAHKRYGEAVAILAGDALLSKAFEVLIELERNGVPSAGVARAVHVLASASGSRELVGGQVLDMEAEGKRVTRARVREIHHRKTGALIAASMVLGGIAGGAHDRGLPELARTGRELGLAFQIHDDLLNRRSSLKRLGKRSGTDDRRKKATWPRAVGDERALEDASHLYMEVLEQAAAWGPKSIQLCHLVVAMAERQK